MKKYHLVYIKRNLCHFILSSLTASILLGLHSLGKYLEFYSDQYQTLIYLSLTSITVLPIMDYVTTLYSNYYKNEFIAIDPENIKIKSTLLFKNSGSQEIKINRDQIKSVSLKYKKLPCLERIVLYYDDSVLTLSKKDFKAREFRLIYEKIKSITEVGI